MQVAIVDDEESMRRQLAEYVQRYAEESAMQIKTVTFPSGDAFLRDYRSDYDIIIFDVDMPGTNGIDTAKQLRKTDADTVILFVTNIAQYAINGYEVDAVDYIIKPIGYYDFSLRFQKAVRRRRVEKGQQLAVETAEGVARIAVADIIYLESQGHYVIFHTRNGDYRVRSNLKDHEADLRDLNFRRTHKSFLVNLQHLENVLTNDVVVAGEKVPLGRAHRDAIISDFMRYIRG